MKAWDGIIIIKDIKEVKLLNRVYDVGTIVYHSKLNRMVDVVFMKALEKGNHYLVKYVESEEMYVYDSGEEKLKLTEQEFYEHVYEHVNGERVLFNTKLEYQNYERELIDQLKDTFSNNDFWIYRLYSVYSEEVEGKIEKEAMREIIQERLDVVI